MSSVLYALAVAVPCFLFRFLCWGEGGEPDKGEVSSGEIFKDDMWHVHLCAQSSTSCKVRRTYNSSERLIPEYGVFLGDCHFSLTHGEG